MDAVITMVMVAVEISAILKVAYVSDSGCPGLIGGSTYGGV